MAARMPEKIRVLMISKACVVGEYQRKLEAIAGYKDIDLTVLVPPAWRDERGTLLLERAHTGADTRSLPAGNHRHRGRHFLFQSGRGVARYFARAMDQLARRTA